MDELLALVRPHHRTSVERFVSWMREDMRKEMESPKTLARYAKTAGLSIGRLSRRFTAIVGRPFRAELRRLRMERAGQLLREKNLTVSAVARMVGLKDTSQFIADFRRELGLTPAAYRESQRG